MDVKKAPVVLIINGPNLNLLGQREPSVYGTMSLDEHMAIAKRTAEFVRLEVESVVLQSMGEMVEAIHDARSRCAGIIVNPGAFTHFGWSVHDALAAFGGPIIEVHISNPASREPWRHQSVVAPVARGTISGFGGHTYLFAMHAIATLLSAEK